MNNPVSAQHNAPQYNSPQDEVNQQNPASNTIGKWLLLFVLLQGCILAGIWVKAAIPLWTGQEIRVYTEPVDPRSLFRGNYAELNYDFSRLDGSEFSHPDKLRKGEVIYLQLEKHADGIWHYQSVSINKPEGGVFLRGRIQSKNNWSSIPEYQLKFGIEAFFAPKEKALALEKQLRQSGAIAVLKVDKNGRARIVAVEEAVIKG